MKYYGRIAIIDLISEHIKYVNLSEDVLKLVIGGRGVASLLLYKLTSKATEPFSQENPLIIMTGPLTGIAPAATKTIFAARSPLSGGLGYSSVGGGFGYNLRRAGVDGLLLLGASEKPVYIVIDENGVSLEDARELWGKRVYEVRSILLRKYGEDYSTAIIGPAGENLVRYAAVIVDEGRAAARTGMGAIMGYKKVKAIIAKGSMDIKVHNPEGLRELSSRLARKTLTSPKIEGYRKYGTMSLVEIKNRIGDLPAYNHKKGHVEDISRLTLEYTYKVLKITPKSCIPCPIHCGRRVYLDKTFYEGLEYETIDSLGPLCGILDIRSIAMLNYEANNLGLDTISLGKCIAWAMECNERGLGVDKIPIIKWGDVEGILKVINDIAYRRGKAAILAEGVKRASEIVGEGTEEYAMHVKSVEIPAQEPRTVKMFGLGHATSNRGADHLYALPCIAYQFNRSEAKKYLKLSERELDELNNPRSPKHKAKAVVFSENLSALTDASGLCKFVTCETLLYSLDEISDLLKYTIGLNYSTEELLEIGERIVNLERLYILDMGLEGQDNLPRRFLKEPYGVTDNLKTVIELDSLLEEYYTIRCWDGRGRPLREKIDKLKIPTLLRMSLEEIIK